MAKPIVLIMAGGKGERFWPRSRESHPKQLRKVYSNKTLLEETILRARTIADAKDIYIGCNAELKKAILKTHKFPKDNFVVEPEGRNTAPIIALAALQLEKKFPGRTHVVLSADHFIAPPAEFKKTMKVALETAERGFLVTLGVKPSRPETGYGYIAAGKQLWDTGALMINSFVEKPDQRRAMSYIKKKNYYWNSGIFIWKGSLILSEFENHAPEVLNPLKKSFNSAAALKKNFSKVPKTPIDIAIMEKSGTIAMVPATFTWDDVGSWLSLERIVPEADGGNTLVASDSKTKLFSKNSEGNIVLSGRKLVALLGVKDVIVVEEDDLLFVASRDGVGDIKEMLAEFRKNPALQKYLR